MDLENQKNGTDIFSSTIIATIGRPTLARAVESVLSQEVDSGDFEVIVVNDSKRLLPVEEWHHSKRVVILNTQKGNKIFARNAGAAVARGRYLHILDDDDWMLPGAFKELWKVALNSNASLICGATRFLDKNGNSKGDSVYNVHGDAFVQIMAGSWIPFQMIKTESFIKVGGYDIRFSTMGQQKDLCRRIAFWGDFANTPHLVACVVRDKENSTANWALEKVASLSSRDNILDEKGAFARMIKSAKTSYWRGKLVRAYLTCVVWNLKNKNIFKLLSRACGVIAGFFLSIPNMLSLHFWHGITEAN